MFVCIYTEVTDQRNARTPFDRPSKRNNGRQMTCCLMVIVWYDLLAVLREVLTKVSRVPNSKQKAHCEIITLLVRRALPVDQFSTPITRLC